MYVCALIQMFVCTYSMFVLRRYELFTNETLNECMYVCMYIHICMYVRTYVCLYVPTVCMYYVDMNFFTNETLNVCMYVCMYVFRYVCMYVCRRTSIRYCTQCNRPPLAALCKGVFPSESFALMSSSRSRSPAAATMAAIT